MSEGMSPYQPPQTEMASEGVPSVHVSSIPRVFGILHLVFGGIGLLMGIVGLGSLAFQGAIQRMQFATYPEEVRDEMMEAMQPLYATQKWDVISTVGSLVLAILLIVAGLKLVKYRQLGRKISNIYSALSVVHKLYALVIVLLVKAPVMKQVGESLNQVGGNGDVDMGAIMGPFAITIGIVSALVMMVYPILSFFLLGKKQARESLK